MCFKLPISFTFEQSQSVLQNQAYKQYMLNIVLSKYDLLSNFIYYVILSNSWHSC